MGAGYRALRYRVGELDTKICFSLSPLKEVKTYVSPSEPAEKGQGRVRTPHHTQKVPV